MTNFVTKTIKKIAEIADVSIWPTCNSTDDDDDDAKDSDNNNEIDSHPDANSANASDGDNKSNGGKKDASAADGEDNPKRNQTLDLPDPSKLTSCSREDITAFVTKLCETDDCNLEEIDILKTKEKGDLVTPWLLLKKKLQVQNR